MGTILHATDFSACADRAGRLAVRLATALGGELLMLHVAVETPLFAEGWMSRADVRRVFDAQREWAARELEERAAEPRGAGVPTLTRVIVGSPHEGIVAEAARAGADLVVMGTHGRGGLERFLLGSVADRVLRTAPCPVVTVRDAAPAGGA